VQTYKADAQRADGSKSKAASVRDEVEAIEK
jgi:hypothetical protein